MIRQTRTLTALLALVAAATLAAPAVSAAPAAHRLTTVHTALTPAAAPAAKMARGEATFVLGAQVANPTRRLLVTDRPGGRSARLVSVDGPRRTIWSGRLQPDGVTIVEERNGTAYTIYLIVNGAMDASLAGLEVATPPNTIASVAATVEGLQVQVKATTWTGIPRGTVPVFTVTATS